MKYNYEFLDEVVEVEISEEWAAVLIEMDRIEYNNTHAETRRHCTLNVLGDEGSWLKDCNDPGSFRNISGYGLRDERLDDALDLLTDRERDAITAIYLEGYTGREYAREKGIPTSTLSELLKRSREKIKKFY